VSGPEIPGPPGIAWKNGWSWNYSLAIPGIAEIDDAEFF
jgi:hypothetical protein